MPPDNPEPPAIDGGEWVELPPTLSEAEETDPVTVEPGMTCSESGDIEGPWTGLPLSAFLWDAAPPAETTHVLAECRDGLRVCVDVGTALEAIVAYRRDGEPLGPEGLRLVGPGVGSGRSAKGLCRIEPIALSADEDPGELEILSPDEEDG